MKTFIKKNWRTTMAGLLSGAPVLAMGILEKNPQKIISGLGLIVLGILGKDANVTGGVAK
jgi:hypothetical protein